MKDREYIQEDEIDLRELFKTIWEKKLFVILFTSIVTLIAIIYVLVKNPIPVYQGKVFLEIGKIQSQTFGQALFDNPTDLAQILNIEYNVETSIPKATVSLLEITSRNENKEEIQNNNTFNDIVNTI